MREINFWWGIFEERSVAFDPHARAIVAWCIGAQRRDGTIWWWALTRKSARIDGPFERREHAMSAAERCLVANDTPHGAAAAVAGQT